jgi:hypothetical protein
MGIRESRDLKVPWKEKKMPTGYTADVCDGKQTEFKDFAMTCARAFGALIVMRDDPMDAEIPQEFAPNTYSADRMAEAQAILERLRGLTPDQMEAEATAAYEAEVASHAKDEAEEAATDARLDAMIEKVKAWTPPTADHVEMKSFMLEQLRISKRGTYRSPVPVKLSGRDWLEAQMAKAERDVGYHAAEQAKENERAKSRTAWVNALRASLRPSHEVAAPN